VIGALILNYANARRSCRKKALRGVGAVVILLVVYSAVRWGPTELRRVQAVYWQNRCSTFLQPATSVVKDEAARTSVEVRPNERHNSFGLPNCLIQLRAYLGSDWGLGNDLGTASGPIIFMHSRIPRGDPSGRARLVIIVASTGNDFIFWENSHALPFAQSYVIEKGSLFDLPKVLPRHLVREGTEKSKVLVFAGQPDSSDTSHFTFEYEFDGKRDTVDGWLESDDQITLRCRNPVKGN
jgi:hypothetical protein